METILVVVEGKKEEPKIIENLEKSIFKDKVIIRILYGTSIYTFYKNLKKYGDYFETIEVLRDMSDKNKEVLKGIKRKDVSSIYLFFDHDSHSNVYTKEKLDEMIEFFYDEYENGKLFLSYPMVEAVRDIDNIEEEYIEEKCYWCVDDNKKYKQHASEVIRNISFMSVYGNYDFKIWGIISRYNWIKSNLLINNKFQLPSYNELMDFSQKLILDKETELVNNKNLVVTLSGFPFFMVNYFKREIIEDILNNKKY